MTGAGQLHEVAHCRAGDKGGDSILVLAPHHPGHFDWLINEVTATRVAAHFGMAATDVGIVVLPGLHAVVLTLRGRLAGGVTRSTGIDPHGKTLSSHLLALPLSGPVWDTPDLAATPNYLGGPDR